MKRISEIVKELKITDYIIQKDCKINNVVSIFNLTKNCVTFVTENFFHQYKNTFNENNLVVLNKIFKKEKIKGNVIFSNNPKYSIVQIFNLLFPFGYPSKEPSIGLNFQKGENCVLKNCIIGNNVTLHSNVTIGESGFGYVKYKDKILNFPHIGKVIIDDNVEIHSNVCIDRGSFSDTIIHKNVKIDNLVHIAHNVEVGENTYIIANSMVGGSTKIGKNCWIAPGCSIVDGISIADNTCIGIGSVVIKSIITPGKTWYGVPAKEKTK